MDLKDKTPRHKQSNVVYAVQCSQECTDLYTGETKQPLHKYMAQETQESQMMMLNTFLLPFFLTPRPLLQPQNKCGPLGIFPFPLISHSLLAFQGGTELTGAVVCAKAIWGSVRGHFDTYTAGAVEPSIF